MPAALTQYLNWRKVFKGTLGALACVLVFTLCLILLGLGSETGRLWLLQTLIESLNRSGMIEIHTKRLSSTNLGNWKAGKIIIKRDNNLWLDIQNAELNWQPDALLRKRIHINKIAAEALKVYNIPEAKNQSNQPGIIALPSFNVQLKQLFLGQLKLIGFGDSKVSQTGYTLQGKASWVPDKPLAFDFSAKSLSSTPSRLMIQSRTLDFRTVTLEGRFDEDSGGLFGELLKLPSTQPIAAGFTVVLTALDNSFGVDVEQLTLPVANHHLLLKSRFSLEKDNLNLRIENLDLDIDNNRQSLSGELIGEMLNFNVNIANLPLDLLTPWNEDLDNGELSARAQISGTLTNPKISGDLTASIDYQNTPAAIKFQGTASKTEIRAEQLDMQLLNAKATARGTLDLAGRTTQFQARVKDLELHSLKQLGVTIPEGLEASISSASADIYGTFDQLQGKAELSTKGQYQQQEFTLQTQFSKSMDTLTIDRVTIHTLQGVANVKGKINTRDLQSNLDINISGLPLSALELSGITLPQKIRANLDGELTLSGMLQKPTIEGKTSLSGFFGEIPVNLDASGLYSKNKIVVHNLRLMAFDEQVFMARGSYQQQLFDVQADIEKMPLKLLSTIGWQMQPGDFSATLKASGRADNPSISAQLAYETIVPFYDFEGESQNAHFRWDLQADTLEHQLHIVSTVQHNGEKPAQLAAVIPIAPYINYLSTTAPSNKLGKIPLAADIKGSIKLQALSFLLDPDLHRISGEINTDIELKGFAEAPEVNGSINISQAGYANSLTGTTIQNINCSVLTSHSTLKLTKCEATDGHHGNYSVDGQMQFPAESSKGAIDMTLQSRNANILRRPDIEAEVTGAINLKGDFKNLIASGNMEASPFMALIDSALNSNSPRIEVEEIYFEKAKSTSISRQYNLPTVALDLVISAQQQAFLRGRGLEAELQGQIRIKGDLHNPDYDGRFTTIRGQLEVFGKKFKLQEGQVSFANNAIAISIPGVYQKNGQEIRAKISGTKDDLTLSLSANPEMAQDEIMAFIIFGKPLQNITPFEAIQLANEIHKLRSGGSGVFDPIGTTREALGVDTLTIDSEKTENGDYGLNLGIGKYLNEKVYLEIERTPNPAQPWRGSVQIELTPKLNLESSTGGETGIEGVELKWKHNY